MWQFLESLAVRVIERLAELFYSRWLKPKSVDKGTYEAKAAEAKELAKHDRPYGDVIDGL